MSYHVFLQEKVDVAVYEVGVGGEYDATNILDRPAVTGITSLGIDHTRSLGTTIESIAWHKAGIQKPRIPSYTVQQLPAAMHVVEQRASDRKVESLEVVDIDPRLEGVKVRPDADFQKLNASLAIALAGAVIRKLDHTFRLSPGSLPQEFVDGIEQVVWRGRFETKVEGNITWYLDGAHTAESIKLATKWYVDECSQRSADIVTTINVLLANHIDWVPVCSSSISKATGKHCNFSRISSLRSLPKLTLITYSSALTLRKQIAH